MTQRQNFINNRYVASHSSANFDLVDPATGETIGQSPNSNKQDVDDAYSAASAATATWGRMTPSARQAAMLKLADAIEARSDDLVEAQVRNTGQPKHLVASEEVAAGVDQIRFFAGAERMLDGASSGEYMEGFNSAIRREPNRGRRADCPVELPDHDGGVEDRTRTGGRQYDRFEAVGDHTGLHPVDGGNCGRVSA